MLALTAWAMVFLAGWATSGPEPATAHPAHVLSSTLSMEFAEVQEHPHLQDAPTLSSPDLFTAARTPRAAAALIAAGLVIIALVATSRYGWSMAPMVRGPPAKAPFGFSGRQILTILCVSRR